MHTVTADCLTASLHPHSSSLASVLAVTSVRAPNGPRSLGQNFKIVDYGVLDYYCILENISRFHPTAKLLSIVVDMPASSGPSVITHTHPATSNLHPSSDHLLLSSLSSSTYDFLQPSQSLHTAALELAKRYLDPLAQSACDARVQRKHHARGKRKRGQPDRWDSEPTLRMRHVHIEGLAVGQIWEQARRVLDASREEIKRSISEAMSDNDEVERPEKMENRTRTQKAVKMVTFDEADDEVGSSSPKPRDQEEDRMSQNQIHDVTSVNDVQIPSEEEFAQFEIAEDSGEDGLMIEQSDIDTESKEVFVQDKNGLNDGFFSIDDFNRQSGFLEQQDARGDPDDGAASDEEDIDWEIDPAALGSPMKRAQSLGGDEARDAEDEENGPTFGDADINGVDTDEASDAEADVENLGPSNTNDIMYADFFAPPPRKASKRSRALPKTQPPPTLAGKSDAEDDIQRTISAVRRDIFEDDLSPNESEDDLTPESDPDAPLSRRSNHERRQAKLAAEIRKLEAANVARRDWTLSGEAQAADRPLNSLLEEDLEFERAGKAIPVITAEVSEDIEALIKRRILAREFDEVIRRRPGDLVTGRDTRRGRFELDDSRPQQSLAEIYEAEHLENVDPEGYVSKRDEKLKEEQEVIKRLWADVSAKLDALSSWHYKPKPPEANINVVADVPTISMEDARPSAGGDVGESMLAPQEIYKAGEGADKKREVVSRSGLVKAREEMTREEKLRRRRREKERIRKAGGLAASKIPESKKLKDKKEVVGQLKRGGVKVIGKKGELKDVDGKAAEGGKGVATSGKAYKL